MAAFRDVICKGAAWTAYSIITNTDLCNNGVPIYFHIEDKIYDEAVNILNNFGIPEHWYRKTSFEEPEHSLDHWLTGKKLAVLFDEEIDTKVKMIWDSDSFVYRAPGMPLLNWYKHFEGELANTMVTSFHSSDNGGDLSYANWILRSIGMPEIENPAPSIDELKMAEAAVYEKANLPMSTKQERYGASILGLPNTHPIIEWLRPFYHNSCTDEGLISLWMNAVGSPFIEFSKVFVPIINSDDEFLSNTDNCIAHLAGNDLSKVTKYKQKFIAGINSEKRISTGISKRSKKRFHIFSVPHNPSHKDRSACAFAQKARKLSLMLTNLGHEVYHYGNELSDVVATEHVTVTTKEDMREAYGDWEDQSNFYPWNPDDYCYKMFFLRTEHEMRKRAAQDDFCCYVFGAGLRNLYDRLQDLPVHHVESGIGYYYPYMKYKVFESPSHRHFTYGVYQGNFNKYAQMSEEEKEKAYIDWNITVDHSYPQWQDAVIPNSFDVEDFEFKKDKDDYFLYLGRIIPHKGIEEAMRISKAVGKKLIVAGQGDFEKQMGFKPWDNVELVGMVKVEERKKLLSNAKALFCMSRYLECFGGVHIEANLSGTPVIATDFGCYVHTVKHGLTGYRLTGNCFEQGMWAVKNLDRIDPEVCRKWGQRFSNENVALKYDEYFDTLLRYIHNNNSPYWTANPERTELDWISDDLSWLDQDIILS